MLIERYRAHARTLLAGIDRTLELLQRDGRDAIDLIADLERQRDSILDIIERRQTDLSVVQFRIDEARKRLAEIERAIADRAAANDNFARARRR